MTLLHLFAAEKTQVTSDMIFLATTNEDGMEAIEADAKAVTIPEYLIAPVERRGSLDVNVKVTTVPLIIVMDGSRVIFVVAPTVVIAKEHQGKALRSGATTEEPLRE